MDATPTRDHRLSRAREPGGGRGNEEARRDQHGPRRRSSSGDGARRRRDPDVEPYPENKRGHRYRQDRRHFSEQHDSEPEPSRGDRVRGRRSRSPDRRISKRRSRSRSPHQKERRRSAVASNSAPTRNRAPLPPQDESFQRDLNPDGSGPAPPPKQKPNFKPTGLLAKEANTVAGTTTVLKYHEPPEARKPPAKDQWRMYVFKKQDLVDTIHLSHRSVWLAGRDKNVTDLLLEHPSISKQHAVIQFRHITATNEYGDKHSMVKPYLIDLDSANGTKLNGKAIDPSRYVEIMDQDVVVFGDSEREYVVMLPSNESGS